MRQQERQLIVARYAIVLIAGLVVVAFRDGLSAFPLVVVVLAVVVAYNTLLAALVGRFPAREVGVVATALDMVAVTVAIYAEPAALDAYLFYIPVILGVALRFGLGASAWASVVVSFMYGSVVLFGAAASGPVAQLLPVRVAYLVGIGLAAGLFARVVIERASENARLQQRLAEEERESAMSRERELLSAMSRDFGDSLEGEATARAVVRGASALIGSATALLLVREARLQLAAVDGGRAEVAHGLRDHFRDVQPRLGEGVAGGAAATATSMLFEEEPPAYFGDPDAVSALGLRSVLAVPIVSRGAVSGVLFAAATERQALGEHQRRLASAIAERAGPALENAALWSDLRDQVAREQQAQRIKDDFLSIVSHELRTPLTSIQGYSQLLEGRLRDADASAKQLSHLGIIRSQVGRMRRLVDDLLDVSRIDRRGGVSIEPAPMDLADELREVVARMERAHRDRSVTLLAPEQLPLEADRDRIAQVLTNLADNAVKYSPQGGPVTISAERVAGEVLVRISDTGVGIPADQLERVFERFHQADDGAGRRRFGGLGLGLYISRAIVEAHGGAIWAARNEAAGQGSVFSFRLPVRAQPRLQPPTAVVGGEPPPFVVRRRGPDA